MTVQRRSKQPGLIAGAALSGPQSEVPIEAQAAPLNLNELVPGKRHWEIELGFGKGRYLLQRAGQDPEIGFLGVELVSRYFRLTAQRAARRGMDNLLVVRSEALYFLSACMPRRFAHAAHVYFPDPWPKARHNNRRLFHAETVDLVLGAIEPGGYLYFATDFLQYGEIVTELLESHPAVRTERIEEWPEGPRTNYEAKYVKEGRPIIRLACELIAQKDDELLHPDGRQNLTVGPEPA